MLNASSPRVAAHVQTLWLFHAYLGFFIPVNKIVGNLVNNEQGLGGKNEQGLGGRNEQGLGGKNEQGLGGKNEQGLGGKNEQGLGGRNEQGLGGRNEQGLGGKNEQGLGGRNEQGLGAEREGLIHNRLKRLFTLRVASHRHHAPRHDDRTLCSGFLSLIIYNREKIWRRSVYPNLTNSKLGWYSHVFNL